MEYGKLGSELTFEKEISQNGSIFMLYGKLSCIFRDLFIIEYSNLGSELTFENFEKNLTKWLYRYFIGQMESHLLRFFDH